MRTPKYRVYIKNWGGYGEYDMMEYPKEGTLHVYFGNWERGGYKEAIFQQFTGLLDKNGKEIYEGDICNTRDEDLLTCYSYNEFIYMVLFSEEHSGVNGYTQKDLEVIGNIYENPELLINKL
jgi:hypothetical protein